MTEREPDVKYIPPEEPGGPLLIVRRWMDGEPAVGWRWVVLLLLANLLVNLLDLLS